SSVCAVVPANSSALQSRIPAGRRSDEAPAWRSLRRHPGIRLFPAGQEPPAGQRQEEDHPQGDSGWPRRLCDKLPGLGPAREEQPWPGRVHVSEVTRASARTRLEPASLQYVTLGRSGEPDGSMKPKATGAGPLPITVSSTRPCSIMETCCEPVSSSGRTQWPPPLILFPRRPRRLQG